MSDRPPEPPGLPTPPGPRRRFPSRQLRRHELRSVCLTILRRHGPQRLRDLHGLLHCYGYFVASVRPVQRSGDAMAYEERCGRARRVARGTYEAVADAPEPPRPGWWGPSPEPDPRPLPWVRPETDPGPPLVDPRVADDPELWSGRAWPGPPDPFDPPNGTPDGRGRQPTTVGSARASRRKTATIPRRTGPAPGTRRRRVAVAAAGGGGGGGGASPGELGARPANGSPADDTEAPREPP